MANGGEQGNGIRRTFEGSEARGGWRKRELLLALGLGLVTVLLWRVPGLGWIFYPFRLYNTYVHELSHGLTAIATGGAFRRFIVHPDLSGTAWSAGGIAWIVTSAGYVGSAVFGGLLAILSARSVPARGVLWALGLALGALCLLFVGNIFGVVAGLVLAAALCAAGRWLPRRFAAGLLLLLAVQMMLNALDSLQDLLQISATSEAVTDARTMAAATGIPAVFWAMLWTAVAFGALLVSLRVAYRAAPDAARGSATHAATATAIGQAPGHADRA